jgi:hypothetical protein
MKQTAVECLKQDIDRELKHGTKMIVNWDMYLQMEKQQQGYSEEEVLELLLTSKIEKHEDIKEWFEQFKKK